MMKLPTFKHIVAYTGLMLMAHIAVPHTVVAAVYDRGGVDHSLTATCNHLSSLLSDLMLHADRTCLPRAEQMAQHIERDVMALIRMITQRGDRLHSEQKRQLLISALQLIRRLKAQCQNGEKMFRDKSIMAEKINSSSQVTALYKLLLRGFGSINIRLSSCITAGEQTTGRQL